MRYLNFLAKIEFYRVADFYTSNRFQNRIEYVLPAYRLSSDFKFKTMICLGRMSTKWHFRTNDNLIVKYFWNFVGSF